MSFPYHKAHVPEEKEDEFPVVLAVVIGLGILLFLIILIFCCVIFKLRKRYVLNQCSLVFGVNFQLLLLLMITDIYRTSLTLMPSPYLGGGNFKEIE